MPLCSNHAGAAAHRILSQNHLLYPLERSWYFSEDDKIRINKGWLWVLGLDLLYTKGATQHNAAFLICHFKMPWIAPVETYLWWNCVERVKWYGLVLQRFASRKSNRPLNSDSANMKKTDWHVWSALALSCCFMHPPPTASGGGTENAKLISQLHKTTTIWTYFEHPSPKVRTNWRTERISHILSVQFQFLSVWPPYKPHDNRSAQYGTILHKSHNLKRKKMFWMSTDAGEGAIRGFLPWTLLS